MADFRGIASFGEGALQGYDKALSNYATISQIAQQRQAEERARQNQALQTLLHGSQLSQTNPEVATMAAQEPDRYGLDPRTIEPGVAQAYSTREAQARLNRALSTGDLEALNDPTVSRHITEKHLPMIQELQMRKKVDAILAGPGSPQEKAQLLLRAGANPPAGLLEAGYPEFVGSKAEATAAGTARGQLPLAEALAQAKAVGQGRGELQFAGPLAGARKSGELGAELSPDVTPAGTPLGGTSAGRLARERETPADRERKLRAGQGDAIKPTDISNALNRNRNQARALVQAALQRVPKETMAGYEPKSQQEIIDYYTAIKERELAKADPVLAGQYGGPEPVRPPIIDEFEKVAEGGGFWQGLKQLFMGESTPTAPITQTAPAPRSLRQPTQSPQASAGFPVPPGAKEGDAVRQKSTGKMFVVQGGQLVPQGQ